MADGYLEKRYEEVFGKGAKKTVVKHIALESLMEKNRSYRGYKKDFMVKREMLERIVAVNTKIASAKNQQVLRFKLVTQETGADVIVQNMKLGGLLPELHLPFEGTEPNAFIIICSIIPENKFVDIDLGIAAQSMLLKATEMGLNGIMIGAFNKSKITEAFNLPFEPLLILAIGKGNEKIKLQPVGEGEKLAYYRDQKGVQFVPKIRWEQLVID
ncbi:MAG: nitroreductase family protein [Bacteroidales bacterium]|nr:nitroreductase family protein [Bacteroidales bacterium]